MRAPPLPRPRGVMLCGIVLLAALALGGCGRRGPLEAPPDPSVKSPPSTVKPASGVPADRRVRPTSTSTSRAAAPTVASSTTLTTDQGGLVEDTPDDENDEEATQAIASPSPTPRKRPRAYVVPKEPFILDPLL